MNGHESLAYPEYIAGAEAYPLLRNMLGEDQAGATAEEIEELFYDLYGENLSPEDMEFAWGALISAIPAVAGAVSNIVQMTSKRRRGRRHQQRRRVRRPAVHRSARPTVAPQTQVVAGQLLNTIMNPQFLNALMSVISGLTNRGRVRTSRGEMIPLEEYTTTLGVLAEDYLEAVALEANGEKADVSYYTAEGIDPLIAEDRAAVIQEIIAEDNEAFLDNYDALLEEIEDRFEVYETPR